MKTVHEYVRHAHECELLARTAISEEQRQMIREMAATWRMLADRRERHLIAQAKIEAIEAGLSLRSAEAAGSDRHPGSSQK